MTPCIEWTGARDQKGYGRVGRRERAHRAAWAEAHGPIPPGMHVLHRCDNPPCVNIEHLFLGTNADNVRDRNAKQRQWCKLTPEQKEAIRSDTRTQRAIAAEYGVSQPLIAYVKRSAA